MSNIIQLLEELEIKEIMTKEETIWILDKLVTIESSFLNFGEHYDRNDPNMPDFMRRELEEKEANEQ